MALPQEGKCALGCRTLDYPDATHARVFDESVMASCEYTCFWLMAPAGTFGEDADTYVNRHVHDMPVHTFIRLCVASICAFNKAAEIMSSHVH